MLAATLVSLGVVFLAELGDKSQLMTMTYALRHRWWVVLSGVGIAAFLVHGLSVTIGHFLGLTLPQRPIAFAAATAFLLFAAWTWRDARKMDDDGDAAVPEPRFVIFAVISSFVLAELGDKTMLATVALASDHNWAGVWLGATVGMVLADGVAIAAGALLHRRLPEQLLHRLASVLFLLFGLWLLFDNALGWKAVAIVATGSVAVVALVAAARTLVRSRRNRHAVPAEPESESATQTSGYHQSNGYPAAQDGLGGATTCEEPDTPTDSSAIVK
jgi:putative Ca2+/H+ antiporter (TMEM165/GDT1 family)